ncbi:MAG: AraC family transcriptional regulator [Lachnospiraceae bacterium]|nr:AraC family transcriptional regulator [Lachnospiraceae bacterium]
MRAKFLSHAALYTGDYDCLFRNAERELPTGLHYHDFYEISFYLGDGGTFLIRDREYMVHKGSVAMIPMFEPHTLLYSKNSGYERFCLSIHPHLLLSYGTLTSNILDIFSNENQNYPVLSLTEEQMEHYEKLLAQLRELSPVPGRDLLEQALIHQFLACLYRDCYDGVHLNHTSSRHAGLVSQLVSYIHTHLDQDLSLDSLARETGYSSYYLCRIFRQVTNHTLNGYIVEKRIFHSAQLIAAGLSCSQASLDAGFHSYSYFYKAFQKHMGLSPTEYLKRLHS